MSEEETKPIEKNAEEATETKSSSPKTEKNPIDKEELEKELQDGIRIEAKLYSPSEKYCQMEKYNLSDADFLALLESLPQKRKARLILSFSKTAFDLVIFNSEVPDRKLYHHQIPMMWSPRHRGRPILGIAVEVNGKYDVVVLKLNDNKGEQFVNKVRFAYREKLLAPPEEGEEKLEKEEKVEEAAKEEKREETDGGLANLVDFNAEVSTKSERDTTVELFADSGSNWANFGEPPAEKAPSAALPDPFAVPATEEKAPGLLADPFSMPPVEKAPSAATSNPFAAPLSEKKAASSSALSDLFSAPAERPQQFPQIAGPPSGKQSPAFPFAAPPPSAPACAPWGQPAPAQPFAAPSGLAFGSEPPPNRAFAPIPTATGRPLQPSPQPPFAQPQPLFAQPQPLAPNLAPAAPFGVGGAFSAPNTPLLGLASASRLSPCLQAGSNPFAEIEPAAPSGTNPFAGPASDASMCVGVLQPEALKTTKSSDSLELLDSFNPSANQQGAPASAKFDDLLASADPSFKPKSQGFATPRDMFAAMQQKPKSLPLNDIMTQ